MVTPLLLFVLAMLGEAGLPAALVGGRFGRQELTLLWLLGLIRVGVYPFHFWLTAPSRASVGAQTTVHLLGPVAGIALLEREGVDGLIVTPRLERFETAGFGRYRR